MDNTNGTIGASTPDEAARRIEDTAATVIDRTKQVAGEKADQGAERIADSAHGTAEALRRASTDMTGDKCLDRNRTPQISRWP